MDRVTSGIRHLLVTAILAGNSAMSFAVDWNGVDGKDVVLFYPGQAAWEWVLVPSDHSAAPKLRQGKVCQDCHEGEEAEIGSLIVSGEKLEPTPPAGKPGSMPVNIAMTHDADTMYVKFEWMDTGAASGASGDFQSRVTMMIGDPAVKESVVAGCWGTCHNDMKDMPNDAGLKKYLSASRTKLGRSGGGENYKSDADLEKLISEGVFMEYWQAKLNKNQPAVAADGYILKDRHANKGTSVQADSTFADGKWTVILSRKLNVDGPHKALSPGAVYPVGFAIHDDYAEHRFHHVSYEFSFVIDQGDADFVVTGH